MPEPSVDDVTAGFETDLDPDAIQATIDDAGVLLRQAYAEGELDDATDTALWKYITRHLIRFEPDRQTTSEAIGSARKEYTGSFAEGLHGTSPGQTALSLDPDGKLQQLSTSNDEMFFRSM